MSPTLPETDAALDAVMPVPRETRERLAVYVALLAKWQKSQNLVAPATLPKVWSRHVADSLQVHAALPDILRWADIGSGAGFPGLVTAICLAGRPGAIVHLVESNKGKAAFLRTVARETGAPAEVHADRIETVLPGLAGAVEGLSARALAPLVELCRMVHPLMRPGVRALFHKGQDFASELAEATQSWDLDVVERPSRIDPAGRLILISGMSPKPLSGAGR